METIHATAVAINGAGVLIRGPSGSGKSDLALRLIDGGAELVADDRTQLTLDKDRVVAGSPVRIAGKLEVRGLGIVELPHKASAPVLLVVDLVAANAVERLPDPCNVSLLGLELPALALAAFEASAAAKVRLALHARSVGLESDR